MLWCRDEMEMGCGVWWCRDEIVVALERLREVVGSGLAALAQRRQEDEDRVGLQQQIGYLEAAAAAAGAGAEHPIHTLPAR